MSYGARIHNIALESNYYDWCESRNTESRRTREHNYYDWHVVRREVQRKSSVAPLDFYDTYDPHKFYDWIAHLDYYFDLYESSDARRVQFPMCKLKFAALYYWSTVERELERIYARPI